MMLQYEIAISKMLEQHTVFCTARTEVEALDAVKASYEKSGYRVHGTVEVRTPHHVATEIDAT